MPRPASPRQDAADPSGDLAERRDGDAVVFALICALLDRVLARAGQASPSGPEQRSPVIAGEDAALDPHARVGNEVAVPIRGAGARPAEAMTMTRSPPSG